MHGRGGVGNLEGQQHKDCLGGQDPKGNQAILDQEGRKVGDSLLVKGNFSLQPNN